MLFAGLKFKNRLLLTFLLVFIPLFSIGSIIAYYQVKKVLQTSIEKELEYNTNALFDLIQTSASVSIKNRLTGIAEKNLDIAEYYYNKYQSGLLSRPRAIELIEEIFLTQSIGISGYIYCLNSKGVLQFHPNDRLKNTDISEFDFVRQQMDIKDGYLEYDWKNPGEKEERPKALYMVYFKPLDWIISVSSYRQEFHYLVDIDDFKASILAHKTGKTGYAYVLNETGTIMVHPDLQGINLLAQSKYPDAFFKKILEKKNGKLKYFWQNPGEPRPREKIVIFKHLPDYHWIVASSSYVDEIFMQLKALKTSLIVILVLFVLLSVAITYFISTSVTRPLVLLMDKLEQGATGDFSVRVEDPAPAEFGKLSRHFNFFMNQLEQNHEKIEAEIQKNIEARIELAERELKFRGLFNHSFQYTAILSPAGILEEMNQSGLDFAGCIAGDVLDKPFWQLPWWRHDSSVQQTVKEAVQRSTLDSLVRFETTAISKENEIRAMDVSIKFILNPMGEVAFIIVEVRDITSYKQAALERKNLAVQLEKAQKMEAIGTLSGGIAHDFNNILSGILGHAQLAELNLHGSEKAKEHIDLIVKGAQRAARLTQQILTFSRQTEYEKHPLSLYLVVKEALKLLRSSIPSTIDIHENIVSKAKIFADATQMHQVIMNLCTNAYQIMGDTGGRLTVGLDEVEIFQDTDVFNQAIQRGKYLRFEVTDTGIGMDKGTLLKAFDPYFTTKEVGKGTGFGLSLVHAIVEAHDGYIKAASRVGKGTSFYVYLPVVEKSSGSSADKQQENLIKNGTETIMLVDDEQDIRLIVKEFLTNCGYRVFIYENGAKALEAFEQDPAQFDLIVTDMTMPRMTGVELSRRALMLRKDIPVILCTGYSESISEASALEMGIQKYVQKPVSTSELAGLIREVLDRVT